MTVKDRDDLADVMERAERAQAAVREATEQLERTVQELIDKAPEAIVQEIAERFHISWEALAAFAQAIAEVLGDHELSVATARRAALLAAAGQAWENELGPLLSTSQVRELLGDVSRQRVDELLRARRLIGLRDSAGRRRFPAFQFHDARPIESLVSVFWTVADAAESEWTAASWCVTPDEALDGRTPLAWALHEHDPERLTNVARQDAARLAR